jgi:hypothetical protein
MDQSQIVVEGEGAVLKNSRDSLTRSRYEKKFCNHLHWEMDKSQIVVQGEGAVLGVGEEVTGYQLERMIKNK